MRYASQDSQTTPRKPHLGRGEERPVKRRRADCRVRETGKGGGFGDQAKGGRRVGEKEGVRKRRRVGEVEGRR